MDQAGQGDQSTERKRKIPLSKAVILSDTLVRPTPSKTLLESSYKSLNGQNHTQMQKL